ncbi:DUF6716 putative glycosyltransferase [Plantibacter sp. YIM 135249]|uniref:DUF6716 putative glycosyltransferase n=1 Tax=Plantibacter sp. YIM 135249 TaxID=3423918 RepID=UPI003D348A25
MPEVHVTGGTRRGGAGLRGAATGRAGLGGVSADELGREPADPSPTGTDVHADRTPPASLPAQRTRRVIGIVDSDSFVKWGATTLDSAPAEWEIELLLLETDVSATDRQVDIALLHTRFRADAVDRLTFPELIGRVGERAPDAVFVATRGPVAEVLIAAIADLGPGRPVILTGLPGISIPPKWKGLFYRAQADVFVLHSHREVSGYRRLAREHGLEPAFALARLPFLDAAALTSAERGHLPGHGPGDAEARPADVPPAPRTRVVFATQATVPPERGDRLRILLWLRALAIRRPDLDVVVKVRGLAGDPQTHHEHFPYDELLSEALQKPLPTNLRVATGSMAVHLALSVGLVTVGSTAAIEALAAGVPVIVLDDFGVDDDLINTVFTGSGLLASHTDLMNGVFHEPEREWLEQNYFHPDRDDDWIERTNDLLDDLDRGTLPARPRARQSRGGALRTGWERKRALGRYDTSWLGRISYLIGRPIQLAKQLLRRLTA